MKEKLTPPFGVSGLWVLKEPFNVPPLKQFRCAAIRSFSELTAMQIDTYNIVYAPHELGRDIYMDDAREGAALVVLMAQDGTKYYVPDTYIQSYPRLGLDNFRRYILACDLGTLPIDTPTTHLEEEISGVIQKTFGRAVSVHTYTAALINEELTETELQLEEDTRQNAIQDHSSTYGQLYDLNKRYGELEDYVRILEDKLVESDKLDVENSDLKQENERLSNERSIFESQNHELVTLTNTLQSENLQLKEEKERLRRLVKQLGGNPD